MKVFNRSDIVWMSYGIRNDFILMLLDFFNPQPQSIDHELFFDAIQSHMPHLSTPPKYWLIFRWSTLRRDFRNAMRRVTKLNLGWILALYYFYWKSEPRS